MEHFHVKRSSTSPGTFITERGSLSDFLLRRRASRYAFAAGKNLEAWIGAFIMSTSRSPSRAYGKLSLSIIVCHAKTHDHDGYISAGEFAALRLFEEFSGLR